MSFSSLPVNQMRQVNDLSRYVIGAAVNEKGEPSGIVEGTALMGGIAGAGWTWKNRKNLKGGVKQLAADAAAQKQLVNSVQKVAPGKPFSKVRNIWAGAGEVTAKAELGNMAAKMAKKPEYEKISKYISSALKNGGKYTEVLKDAEKMKAVANLTKYEAKVASQMANGSTLRAIKNATGITKLSKATKSLAVKSSGFRSLLKGVKGNAAFAAISLGIGVVTDVIPAFQLGADKGFKQLGKTAVKTGAEVAGWAAGSALGAKAGAAIGTCIGGPIGTVVGGAIGLVGGFLGSFLCSKLADKVVGPSEVELAQKDAANDISKSAMTDVDSLSELAQTSYQQLVEHAAAGQLSEDDIAAKKSLEKILGQEINLDEAVLAYKQAESQEAQGTQNVQQPEQQVSEAELLAAQNAQNQALLAQQEAERKQQELEAKKAEEEKQKAQAQPQYSPYQSTLTNPFMASTNPYSLNNPYGFGSYNMGMNNFNPFMMNTNNYNNDMYYSDTFRYNPNIS